MNNELVSVITPLYNSARFIAETIESVIAHTYQEWEMIIVDDCSSDNSVEIVKQYQTKDNRIKLIRLDKQSGPAVARNRAIEASNGNFIAFLDSDDLWAPEKLVKQVSFMKEKNSVLSYTAYQKIDEMGNRKGIIEVPKELNYNKILRSNYIACSTAMYDKTKLGKVYMPNILKRQDHGLWLKILKAGHNAYGINELLGLYRVRQTSVSSNKLIAAKYQWKLYREIEQMPFIHSLYYFLHYAYIGFRKYTK